MSKRVFLTTFDNPYDPETQFASWYLFDNERYQSCDYLSRIARTSESLSDEENNEEIERAIDEIIDNDFMGIYEKIVRETEDKD